MAQKYPFKNRLPEVSAPTLVIAGLDDPFYTPALFREMAAGIFSTCTRLFTCSTPGQAG